MQQSLSEDCFVVSYLTYVFFFFPICICHIMLSLFVGLSAIEGNILRGTWVK